MSTTKSHKSKITEYHITYGPDSINPLLSAMKRLVALSRLMTINALEGVNATEDEVLLLTELISRVQMAVSVFDEDAIEENLPF